MKVSLSKKEIDQIRRAAERIFSGQEEFSCCSVSTITNNDDGEYFSSLRNKYADFFELEIGHARIASSNATDLLDYARPIPSEVTLQRTLMLLLFAETKGVL